MDATLTNIDWISCHQLHHFEIGLFGEYLVKRINLKDGQIVFEKVIGYQHPGSYDTNIRIVCDGNRVAITGNPSSYGRLDNVFGYKSTVEAIECVYNPILAALGLPLFDLDVTLSNNWYQSSEVGLHWEGCRLTRVDLCKNFSLGSSDDIVPFMRWLATHSDRMKAHLFSDDAVEWGGKQGSPAGNGTKWVYRKCYNKAAEFGNKVEKFFKNEGSLSPVDMDYIGQLHEWLYDKGIIRYEAGFKSRYLTQKNVFVPAHFDRGIEARYSDYAEIMKISSGVEVEMVDDIRIALLGLKYGKRMVTEAKSYELMGVYNEWTRGVDIRSKLKRANFHRVKAIFLQIGVDISFVNTNVVPIPLRVVRFNLSKVSEPSFYRSIKVG